MAVFCSDIDGTLLNPERTLSPRTIQAIRHVRDAGHTFVLCSSRMPASMRILERLYAGENAPLIAYNGGLVLSASGDVVRNTPIPPNTAIQIYELCDRLGVHGSFYSGDDWHVWADDRWADREINNTGVQPRPEKAEFYASSGAITTMPPHKIMCMGDEHLINQIEASLSTVSDVVTYRSKPTYLEIANAECDKGSGLRAVEADLGVDVSDCYFFGDNYNDLPAFDVVGTSIAVANAKDAVLAAATVVTASHHDDGVAQYLESWLSTANRG
ncbi:HAD family phosphatase [Salinibacterium sp. NG22]|uniref:Cof-type HAD-IIB family hydrolase n=1 Tax=Salinibacterium sp. NG22 TaxID=2792040 RepID=UPI0018CFE85D|nr:Cof-type HAD-IIB family hydrolase [Salinibacterium sp. NG22]MBH0109162.1 HAD family phosphatase [Salinibacterium sp. NG22]